MTRTSDALDLQSGVFNTPSARDIAVSLKRSAERGRRRKSPPLRSAMTMLTFYINRAGKAFRPVAAERWETPKSLGGLKQRHTDIPAHAQQLYADSKQCRGGLWWANYGHGMRRTSHLVT